MVGLFDGVALHTINLLSRSSVESICLKKKSSMMVWREVSVTVFVHVRCGFAMVSV